MGSEFETGRAILPVSLDQLLAYGLVSLVTTASTRHTPVHKMDLTRCCC